MHSIFPLLVKIGTLIEEGIDPPYSKSQLGMSPSQLVYLERKGYLRTVKVEGKYRFYPSSLFPEDVPLVGETPLSGFPRSSYRSEASASEVNRLKGLLGEDYKYYEAFRRARDRRISKVINMKTLDQLLED
jgi:hypothetical protein